MSRVYGDSTPFPHDLDYIQMLRDGIDCSVRLLSAQHSIRAAMQRADIAEKAKQHEASELDALFERVQSAATSSLNEGLDRTVRTAAQIVAGTRSMVDAAIRDLDANVAVEVNQARHIVDKAREITASAIEQYLEQHSGPGSRLCLQLLASNDANSGHVTVITPYGVSAVFGVAIPPSHVWARPRRVGDVVANIEIHMPKESGWLSKRVEMTPVRLERFFISDVMWSGRSGLLRMRRGAASGSGYQLRVELDNGMQLSMSPVGEDGRTDDSQPLVLEGNDQTTMLGLWKGVVASSRDLMGLRRRMVSAAFLDRPLLEVESPRALAEALIADMAPTVVEISRRSGAPGELVLRRNLGEGRREETYCTHSELLEKVLVLPPDLRSAFGSLNLSGPLTTTAPKPNASHAADIESRGDVERPRNSSTNVPKPVPNGAVAAELVASAAQMPARPPSVPPPENTPAA
jgi:hypothetical protein